MRGNFTGSTIAGGVNYIVYIQRQAYVHYTQDMNRYILPTEIHTYTHTRSRGSFHAQASNTFFTCIPNNASRPSAALHFSCKSSSTGFTAVFSFSKSSPGAFFPSWMSREHTFIRTSGWKLTGLSTFLSTATSMSRADFGAFTGGSSPFVADSKDVSSEGDPGVGRSTDGFRIAFTTKGAANKTNQKESNYVEEG